MQLLFTEAWKSRSVQVLSCTLLFRLSAVIAKLLPGGQIRLTVWSYPAPRNFCPEDPIKPLMLRFAGLIFFFSEGAHKHACRIHLCFHGRRNMVGHLYWFHQVKVISHKQSRSSHTKYTHTHTNDRDVIDTCQCFSCSQWRRQVNVTHVNVTSDCQNDITERTTKSTKVCITRRSRRHPPTKEKVNFYPDTVYTETGVRQSVGTASNNGTSGQARLKTKRGTRHDLNCADVP